MVVLAQVDGKLDRTGWTATGSNNGSHTWQFLDGDPSTRWHGSYQEVGKWIQVDMGADQTFDLITLDTANAPTDAPRGFEVYLAKDDDPENFELAATGGSESASVTEIKFSTPQTARYIKIVLTENDSQYYFAIYEFYVWNTAK